MRRVLNTVMAVAFLAMAFACNREEQNTTTTGEISISIDGVIDGYAPQDETKSEVQTVARVLWANGDKVHIFDGTRHIGILTADITETDGLYAKLNGTIQTPSGSVVTLVHSPQLPVDSAPVLSGNKLCLDLSTQEGADVPFLVYGTLPSPTSTSVSNKVVNFSLATSIYKVNCTGLRESGDFIRAEIGNVNTVCALTLLNDGGPVVSGEKMGRIIRSGDGSYQAKDERAYISFSVVKSDSGDREFSVRKTCGVYSASFDNKSLEESKSYNIVLALKNAYPDGAVPGVFTIQDKQYYFAHGNLWYGRKDGASVATCNFEDQQFDYPKTWDPNHVSLFYWSSKVEVAGAQNYDDPGASNKDILFTNYPGFTANGQKGMWRTLEMEDWYNLIFDHGRIGRAEVTDGRGGVHCGIVILPDGFINPLDKPFMPYRNYSSDENTYTFEEFTKMEREGVAFLPNPGSRNGGNLSKVGEDGSYFASSESTPQISSEYFYYIDKTLDISQGRARTITCSIRLVSEKK